MLNITYYDLIVWLGKKWERTRFNGMNSCKTSGHVDFKMPKIRPVADVR